MLTPLTPLESAIVVSVSVDLLVFDVASYSRWPFMTDFFHWCSIFWFYLVVIWILTSFLEMRWHSVDGHFGSFYFLAFTNGSSEGWMLL